MRRRYRCVGPAVALSLTLAGCSAEDEAAGRGSGETPAAATQQEEQPAEPEAEPQTVADFLGLAEKAMAEKWAWTFAVQGEEVLTLQGQENAASFEATVRRSGNPFALHSQGVVTGDDGVTTPEEIYVLGGTAYLKDGDAAWRQRPAAEPEMRNRVEDPVAVLEQFTAYAEAREDAVALTQQDGTVRIGVAIDSQKLSAVRDRGAVKKALREFGPTAEQLRDAGVAVDEEGMTVAALRETLVLDAETYRIESHRFRFELLLPYGSDDISLVQDVREENRGAFEGAIQLPEDVA